MFYPLTGTYAPDVAAVNTISLLNNNQNFYAAFPGVVVQTRVDDDDLSLVLMDGQGENKNVISNPDGQARFKIILADGAIVPTEPTIEYK